MRRNWIAASLGALVCLIGAEPVFASSPDAWAAFRANISKKCLAAAQAEMTHVRVRVDPFQAPSYGFGVVYGRDKFSKGKAIRLCVYDKISEKVELTDDIPNLHKKWP